MRAKHRWTRPRDSQRSQPTPQAPTRTRGTRDARPEKGVSTRRRRPPVPDLPGYSGRSASETGPGSFGAPALLRCQPRPAKFPGHPSAAVAYPYPTGAKPPLFTQSPRSRLLGNSFPLRRPAEEVGAFAKTRRSGQVTVFYFRDGFWYAKLRLSPSPLGS
jgi:hypothetical protein